MNSLSQLFTGARVRPVSSDGVPAATLYFGPLGERVTADGDLILAFDDHPFGVDLVEQGVLDYWAELNRFSMSGIDKHLAFWVLMTSAFGPFMSGLGASPGAVGPNGTGEARAVLVRGDFAVSALVDGFDGPFSDDEGFCAAVARRVEWLSEDPTTW